MTRERVDVLVVGGGPAGLATAEAASKTAQVLVVHRDSRIGWPVRTSGGSWRIHADRLGLPASLYQEVRTLVFQGPTKEATVEFDEDCPVVFDVAKTYEYLAQRAHTAGAEIECGARLSGVQRAEEGTLVCRILKEGQPRDIEANFLVDASGFAKSALRSLQLANRPSRFGVGAEYEFENAGWDMHRAALFVGTTYAPAGYGWVFPTPSGRIRVGVGVIRPDTNASPRKLLNETLDSPVVQRLGLRVGRLVERHFGVVPADGLPKHLVHGRVLAVGDSASQALPLAGEGIRYSIEAGRTAGDALARAASDQGRYREHLSRYERWWNRTYRTRFKLAQRVNERISGYLDPSWNRKIDLVATMRPAEVARAFRMELGMWQLLALALAHPSFLLKSLLR